MGDLSLLSEVSMAQISICSPRSRGWARVENRRVLSVIMFIPQNGLCLRDAITYNFFGICGCPVFCKLFFEQFWHVIGCGHLSGLVVRRCICRGPVWRYATWLQYTFAGFLPGAKDWLCQVGSSRSFTLTAQSPPHIPTDLS